MVNWRGRRESENVEDRRDEGGTADSGFQFPGGGGGGGMQLPIGKGGIGIFGILIALGLMFFFGIDPSVILGGGGGGGFPMPKIDRNGGALPKFDIPGLPGTKGEQAGGGQAPAPARPAGTDDAASFVKVVLADTEDIWTKQFASFGQRYSNPALVLYTDQTRTACGPGQAMMGPFYCPIDQKVYLDLNFFTELSRRFGAPGDFAQAYVVAHEIGHHVQKQLGIADKVQQLKEQVSEADANGLQVRMELQADCLAGVFANQDTKLNNFLQQGDIEEGLNAAAQIGDDNLQKKATGRVMPEAFTHGTSEQRVRWFRKGVESGNMQACDTFNTDQL